MSIPYYDCIVHHALRQPESLAAVDLATGRYHSYAVFNDRISRLAGSLQSRFGIAPPIRLWCIVIGGDWTNAPSACYQPPNRDRCRCPFAA